MLPGRTMETVNDEPAGGKKAKERVTINACTNASGTINILTVIKKINLLRVVDKVNAA